MINNIELNSLNNLSSSDDVKNRIRRGYEYDKSENIDLTPESVLPDYILYKVFTTKLIKDIDGSIIFDDDVVSSAVDFAKKHFPDYSFDYDGVSEFYYVQEDVIENIIIERFKEQTKDDVDLDSDNNYDIYSSMWIAHEFAKKNKEFIRYHSLTKRWYICNKERIWVPDIKNEVSIKIIHFIKNDILTKIDHDIANNTNDKIPQHLVLARKYCSGPYTSTNVERELKKILSISDFNQNKTTINLRNGIFDLTEMILRERKCSDHYTLMGDIFYDPDAKCPIWHEILETVQPSEDVRDFLQKLAGYSLTALTTYEKLTIFIGEGGNGKSTYLTGLRNILGKDYSVIAPPEIFKNTGNNDVRRSILEGKRLAFNEEHDKSITLHGNFIKQTASRSSLLSARHMYCPPYEFQNTCKIILSANHIPKIDEVGSAIERRLIVIPWNIKVAETELIKYYNDLEMILKEEAPGIFNWAVEGLKKLLREGIDVPPSLEKYQSFYMSFNNPVDDFISEMCLFNTTQPLVDDKKVYVLKSEVYRVYKKWCIMKGIDNPLGSRDFADEFLKTVHRKDKSVDLIKHNTGFVYKNIRLRSVNLS